MGEDMPPLEENSDLPYFTPGRAHLLLQRIYGDFMHQNDGSYLDGGFTDDAIWKRRWCRLAAKSASW